MKVNFKNCGKETLSSQETGDFIVMIAERKYLIAIAGKYNS